MIQELFVLSSKGEKYIHFSNEAGKSWLMPTRNMGIALNLYQPSSRNGKLIKFFFPYIYWVPLVRKIFRARKLHGSLQEAIYQKINDLFKENGLQFSIFFGTPSIYQKPTIQISLERKILAYCKVSDKKEIIDLFLKEKWVLDHLNDCGVKNVPKCIFCNRLETLGRNYLFVQTTIKTANSKTIHTWTTLHNNFLTNLFNKTNNIVRLSDSDFGNTLRRLEENLVLLSDSDAKTIDKAISKVRQFYGEKEIIFSMFHGDFTPWNMFIENGELFVFDFEYAQLTYPPFLDYFHFLTQVGIIEKGLEEEQLYQFYLQQRKTNKIQIENVDSKYLQYLLSIFSLYISITKGKLSPNDRSYRSWIYIIRKLIK